MDIDLVAYLAIKYDAEIKKSESYQMEMYELRDVSSKLEEMYQKSVSEVGELSGYVKQLQNVSDQRIMAIVHESEENIALQQRLAEITDSARQVALNESQQIVLRDQEANAAVAEARVQASGVVAEMREGFNKARIEFNRQNLMPRHYESREASFQLVQQAAQSMNERLEMKIGLMNHEFQSAVQITKTEFEIEMRRDELLSNEEAADLKNRNLSLEMEVAKQHELMNVPGNQQQALMLELRHAQTVCDDKEKSLVALRHEVGLLRADRESLMKVNARLLAQQPTQGTTTPRAGSTSNHSWVVTGNSPQTAEEEAEAQRRRQEMDDIRDELKQARADVDRLRDDRNAYKMWYREEEAELYQAMSESAEAAQGNASWTGPQPPPGYIGMMSMPNSSKMPSRKEEAKVIVPSWPKISDIGIWKMHVVACCQSRRAVTLMSICGQDGATRPMTQLHPSTSYGVPGEIALRASTSNWPKLSAR